MTGVHAELYFAIISHQHHLVLQCVTYLSEMLLSWSTLMVITSLMSAFDSCEALLATTTIDVEWN